MKPARLFGMLLAGVFAAFTFSPASALELTGTRRIWDQAPHSAFTGLIDYEGKLYCCFREAKAMSRNSRAKMARSASWSPTPEKHGNRSHWSNRRAPTCAIRN
ncbi:MAG: hypothetical protein ACLTZY_07780 [Alistipes indistinctus]